MLTCVCNVVSSCHLVVGGCCADPRSFCSCLLEDGGLDASRMRCNRSRKHGAIAGELNFD